MMEYQNLSQLPTSSIGGAAGGGESSGSIAGSQLPPSVVADLFLVLVVLGLAAWSFYQNSR
jgi:hypothetical protein